MFFVSSNKLLTTIFLPSHKLLSVCAREWEWSGMSQHFIQYTVESLSTILHGSLVCISLTVTSCGCLVSEQMFGRQVWSKLLSHSAAVDMGSKSVGYLSATLCFSRLNFKGNVLVLWKYAYLLSCTNISASLPQKTLLLKHLVSSPAFNSANLWHHTRSQSHTFAC